MLKASVVIYQGSQTYLRRKQGGAGSDAPAHERFGDPAFLDALTDLVLLRATNLKEGRK